VNDTERMSIVAEELMLSRGELEALVSAADCVRVAISPSELIAAVSRGDAILVAVARQAHPSAAYRGRRSRLR
jgi:hypothetical protein